MGSNRTERIAYANGQLSVQIPERARTVTGNPAKPPITDIASAVREALHNPIAHQPLPSLVSSSSKVTIAFDDAAGAYFRTKHTDFRQIAIEIILEELLKAGVQLSNITLLLAQGLHRKLTRVEMETFLGRKIIMQFGYNQLYAHDAEDPDQLIHLGYTHRNWDVEVNRAIVESDQFIYLNTMWAPFNGGWKSTAVGLGTFRSIRHHHRPFPAATGQSVDDPKNSSFKKLVWEQGAVIEKYLEKKGRRIFTIESVYDNQYEKRMIALFGGGVAEVHEHTLQAMDDQLKVDVEGQTDILLAGIDNDECYSKFSVMNPILVTNQALANTVMQFQNQPLVREGGIAIIAHPLNTTFDQRRFSPYIEFYERLLTQERDPYWLWENYVDDFAHRPEYIHGYRYGYAYHGAHPFFMWNSTLMPRRYLNQIYFAGVKDFDVAARLGFEAFPTVEEAIAAAQSELGVDASMTVLQRPPHLIPRVV